MKNALIVVVISGLWFSCDSRDYAGAEIERTAGNNLTGKWRLIEQLMDIGDGRGAFTKVESDHMVEFFEDGTFKSSESLCRANKQAEPGTSGTVDFIKSVLVPRECQQGETSSMFELAYDLQQSNLIINLFCIEPCALKFEKVEW